MWHPLSVHFPVTLLLAAVVTRLTAFFIGLRRNNSFWIKVSRLSLFIGVLTVWLAVFTGNLADGIVSRTLCDPTILKAHENFAIYTAWIFTTVLLIDFASLLPSVALDFLQKKMFQLLLLITLLTGAGFLTYVGHLGSDLVYNQAAGVEVPSSDCSEFE